MPAKMGPRQSDVNGGSLGNRNGYGYRANILENGRTDDAGSGGMTPMVFRGGALAYELHVLEHASTCHHPSQEINHNLLLTSETTESRTRKRLQKSMSEAAYAVGQPDILDGTSNVGDVQANSIGRRRQSVRDPNIFAPGPRIPSGGLPRRRVAHL